MQQGWRMTQLKTLSKQYADGYNDPPSPLRTESTLVNVVEQTLYNYLHMSLSSRSDLILVCFLVCPFPLLPLSYYCMVEFLFQRIHDRLYLPFSIFILHFLGLNFTPLFSAFSNIFLNLSSCYF